MSIPKSAVMLFKDARAGAGSKTQKMLLALFFLKTQRRVKMPARGNFKKQLAKNPGAEK